MSSLRDFKNQKSNPSQNHFTPAGFLKQIIISSKPDRDGFIIYQ
jgi:hypothetical protein